MKVVISQMHTFFVVSLVVICSVLKFNNFDVPVLLVINNSVQGGLSIPSSFALAYNKLKILTFSIFRLCRTESNNNSSMASKGIPTVSRDLKPGRKVQGSVTMAGRSHHQVYFTTVI
jgi:hypothetical protein